MKSMCTTLSALMALTAVLLTAGTIQATKPELPVMYDCEIEPLSYDAVTGRAVVEITLRQRPKYSPTCKGVTLQVTERDGLTYSGPDEWVVPVNGLEPATTTMEITVPANDTSGFMLVTRCDAWRWNWPRYFIASGDSIEAVWSDPREWVRIGQPMPEEELIRLSNIEFQKLVKEQQANREPPPQGHGGYRQPVFSPKDSALADSLSHRDRLRFAYMRRKEREPLAGAERELFEVGGRWFVRLEGENVFHRLPSYTREEMKEREEAFRKEFKKDPEGYRYEVLLDLRDAGDFERAKALADSLEPTVDSGYFRTRVRKDVIKQFYELGIRYLSDWVWPWEIEGKR